MGREYCTPCNLHQKQGEELFNFTHQGDDPILDHHNISGCSPGFTARLQDTSQGRGTSRDTSSVMGLGYQVNFQGTF